MSDENPENIEVEDTPKPAKKAVKKAAVEVEGLPHYVKAVKAARGE